MSELHIGTRVAIVANDGTNLGLGTFIGEEAFSDMGEMIPEFLLDGGVCIMGNQCMWGIPKQEYPMPPIHVAVRGKMRLFARDNGRLVPSGELLPIRTRVEITRIEALEFDGGTVAAIPLLHKGAERYLLIMDIDFQIYREPL